MTSGNLTNLLYCRHVAAAAAVSRNDKDDTSSISGGYDTAAHFTSPFPVKLHFLKEPGTMAHPAIERRALVMIFCCPEEETSRSDTLVGDDDDQTMHSAPLPPQSAFATGLCQISPLVMELVDSAASGTSSVIPAVVASSTTTTTTTTTAPSGGNNRAQLQVTIKCRRCRHFPMSALSPVDVNHVALDGFGDARRMHPSQQQQQGSSGATCNISSTNRLGRSCSSEAASTSSSTATAASSSPIYGSPLRAKTFNASSVSSGADPADLTCFVSLEGVLHMAAEFASTLTLSSHGVSPVAAAGASPLHSTKKNDHHHHHHHIYGVADWQRRFVWYMLSALSTSHHFAVNNSPPLRESCDSNDGGGDVDDDAVHELFGSGTKTIKSTPPLSTSCSSSSLFTLMPNQPLCQQQQQQQQNSSAPPLSSSSFASSSSPSAAVTSSNAGSSGDAVTRTGRGGGGEECYRRGGSAYPGVPPTIAAAAAAATKRGNQQNKSSSRSGGSRATSQEQQLVPADSDTQEHNRDNAMTYSEQDYSKLLRESACHAEKQQQQHLRFQRDEHRTAKFGDATIDVKGVTTALVLPNEAILVNESAAAASSGGGDAEEQKGDCGGGGGGGSDAGLLVYDVLCKLAALDANSATTDATSTSAAVPPATTTWTGAVRQWGLGWKQFVTSLVPSSRGQKR